MLKRISQYGNETMRIGKQTGACTANATPGARSIAVRGRDLCHDLIGESGVTHCNKVAEVRGPRSRAVVSQSDTFACADTNWIAFDLPSPVKLRKGLHEATGMQALRNDRRFSRRLSRITHQAELIAAFAPVFATDSRDHRCAALEAAGVPCSAVFDGHEALDDPQAWLLGIKLEERGALAHTVTTAHPSVLDAHGTEIRRELDTRRRH